MINFGDEHTTMFACLGVAALTGIFISLGWWIFAMPGLVLTCGLFRDVEREQNKE